MKFLLMSILQLSIALSVMFIVESKKNIINFLIYIAWWTISWSLYNHLIYYFI